MKTLKQKYIKNSGAKNRLHERSNVIVMNKEEYEKEKFQGKMETICGIALTVFYFVVLSNS